MNYWEYHDNKIKELRQLYEKYSRQTKNKLSYNFAEINNLKFNTVFDYATKEYLKKIKSQIDEWDSLKLTNGYFKYLSKDIYQRKKVKLKEIFMLLILFAFIEENSKLEDKELEIFRDDVNNYYVSGQKEVKEATKSKREVSIISDALFFKLLQDSTVNGFNFYENKENFIINNAESVYKQVMIDIEQGKKLDIDSDTYKKIFNKQLNNKICINDNKTSGYMEQELIALNNKAKIAGITKLDYKSKVRFIAVED